MDMDMHGQSVIHCSTYGRSEVAQKLYGAREKNVVDSGPFTFTAGAFSSLQQARVFVRYRYGSLAGPVPAAHWPSSAHLIWYCCRGPQSFRVNFPGCVQKARIFFWLVSICIGSIPSEYVLCEYRHGQAASDSEQP